MKKNENKTCSLPIRLDVKLRDNFKKYCDDNGYSMAKRIRILMLNDIKKHTDEENI